MKQIYQKNLPNLEFQRHVVERKFSCFFLEVETTPVRGWLHCTGLNHSNVVYQSIWNIFIPGFHASLVCDSVFGVGKHL